MADKLQYASQAGKALVSMFADYAKLNPRELPELMKKQGGELAGNLYRLTPAASKTEIQQQLESLGPRFIRAPRSFALKVGPKAKAYFKANASKVERKARLGRKKAAKLNKIRGNLSAVIAEQLEEVSPNKFKVGRGKNATFTTGLRQGLTLTEEKFAALKIRMARRGALAASWVPALRALGSKMKVAAAAAGKASEYPQSQALFYGDPDAITVDIINTAPGIAEENDKTHFVDSALDATTKNMQEYRDRKIAEMAIRFRKAAAQTRN
jgi:hypothetical protein